MTVNGLKIRSKDVEPTAGSTVECTKASGLIIIWMEWESIPGLMAVATWVSIWTIRSMGMEYTNGLTVDFT